MELDPNLSSLCLLSTLAMMMEIRRERGDRRCHEKSKVKWETYCQLQFEEGWGDVDWIHGATLHNDIVNVLFFKVHFPHTGTRGDIYLLSNII